MSRSTGRGRSNGGSAKYQDVDRLVNADGLVAVVSQRRSNGELTFAIFREFVNGDGPSKTQFVPQRLLKSYMALLKLTDAAMEKMVKTGVAGGKPLPFPINGRSADLGQS